jgi:hypothetical protein
VEVAVTSGSRSGWDVAALVGRRSPPLLVLSLLLLLLTGV